MDTGFEYRIERFLYNYGGPECGGSIVVNVSQVISELYWVHKISNRN